MSTEKKDRYKELYSKYVDHSVNLHNYHLIFVKHMGYDTGLYLRKSLRNMITLLKEMQKTCREAYAENKQNLKDQKKAEKEYKKANPKRPGRRKGIKNGNNSTKNASSV
jgi:Sec-independent protein translocase protein TatA